MRVVHRVQPFDQNILQPQTDRAPHQGDQFAFGEGQLLTQTMRVMVVFSKRSAKRRSKKTPKPSLACSHMAHVEMRCANAGCPALL